MTRRNSRQTNIAAVALILALVAAVAGLLWWRRRDYFALGYTHYYYGPIERKISNWYTSQGKVRPVGTFPSFPEGKRPFAHVDHACRKFADQLCSNNRFLEYGFANRGWRSLADCQDEVTSDAVDLSIKTVIINGEPRQFRIPPCGTAINQGSVAGLA